MFAQGTDLAPGRKKGQKSELDGIAAAADSLRSTAITRSGRGQTALEVERLWQEYCGVFARGEMGKEQETLDGSAF